MRLAGMDARISISMTAMIIGSLWAASAHAQSADQEPKGTVSEQEIVATGSRVTANGNAQPPPVTAMTADRLLDASPRGLAEGVLPLFSRPHDTLIQEIFKITDGKIQEINVIRQDMPYQWGSGW